VTRIRLRFTKQGKIRFTSHRDVARMWERALRRAQVPVALTEGFSPRPKLAFGLALPTGAESLGEYLDVELVSGSSVDAGSLPGVITPELPVGMACVGAEVIDPRAPSLQQDVTACTWEIEVAGAAATAVDAAVTATMATEEIVVTRTRKGHAVTDDIRPAVRTLEVSGTTEDGVVVVAELATQPRGLRPGELVDACLPGAEVRRVVRLHQWIERDGARREPLSSDATSPAPAFAAGARA
jgi:radical SAM-linked protein